jgi:putative ABC transport system ATP-binding protein
MTTQPLITMRGVGKRYPVAGRSFTALLDVDLEVQAGEFVAIVGKSGSGKSTLLNLLAGIDSPSAGEIHVAGTAVHALDQERLSVWRGRHVGIVFQFFQLLPTLTVVENVMLPMDFCQRWPSAERRPRALALLGKLGILEQADKLPSDLSGGQQQRAAIARALANDPPLLVADEPTGNLDTHTAGEVIRLFQSLASEGRTIIMVTHDREYAPRVSRVVTLRDGAFIPDASPEHAREVHHA